MTDMEQKKAAKKFKEQWKGKGYEKGMSQPFWLSLLRDVYGISEPENYITFEDQVKLDHTSFIDAIISDTKVMIEQKSIDKRLDAGIRQSDGSYLTPFQQAKRYIVELPLSKHPKWVITCNFAEFNIYDMEHPSEEPEVIFLKDLDKEYYRLKFLVEKQNESIKREMEISLQAGELVGKLYDEILKQYREPITDEILKSLNVLCVRLVFCLYAEDSGIFGRHNMFHDYLKKVADRDMGEVRDSLVELFKILDQKEEERDQYARPDLLEFPYVNGGLFAKTDIIIPRFNEKIVALLLDNASGGFKWADISPTIFGAVFESTLNPETRRKGGMHYTSIENIHKVIDPLFFKELRDEYEGIMRLKTLSIRKTKLEVFQSRLSGLKFLDPACGSGNFLTETYISIRRLENKVIRALIDCETRTVNGQVIIGAAYNNPVKVSISQFYGIEINDFAVTVAKTALWISESQMLKETEEIIHSHLEFLPLKTNAYIVEGNSLRIDWESVVPKSELDYIMGNPPFVGARMMEQGGVQKKEVQDIFGNIKEVQDLDYVTCWYKIAANYIKGTKIEVCFVSTNSICQGSQVPILWNVLLNDYSVHINFAYRTFKWSSESSHKAAVYCVIVGFANFNREVKWLYSDGLNNKIVSNISPYLIEGSDSFVVASKESLYDKQKMNFGNQPRDGGYFVINENERDEILAKEPDLNKWIHPYIGAEEFINGKKRWCLWLKHATPADIKNSKILYGKVESVRQFRIASKAKTTNGYARVPYLFAQITQPDDADYLIIPSVSSERRRYIPIGFMSSNVISSNAVQIIPNATLYDFGVLTSNVHMAWMRTACGRLKSDYRYSKEIVYNTFPWCVPTKKQKQKIEQTAQGILNARALYPDCSFADLYDNLLMPPELRKAHEDNDRAVMAAYGFTRKSKNCKNEEDIVAELMKMYQEKVLSKH